MQPNDKVMEDICGDDLNWIGVSDSELVAPETPV